VYVWEPRIAPQMMWWTRRFVPVVLVFLVVCAAIAVAWLLNHRGRWRWPAVAAGGLATVWVLVIGLSQSVPLRSHDEWGGSLALVDQIGALAAEEPSVFVWLEPNTSMVHLGMVPTTWFGAPSLSLEEHDPAVIDALAEAYPGRRLILMNAAPTIEGSPEPATVKLTATVTRWDEQLESVPDHDVEREIEVWAFVR
jgi:hypothetical protein